MAAVHRQRDALRPVQDVHVPGQVGRPVRRRPVEDGRAQAHHRPRRPPRRRGPVARAQEPGQDEVRRRHARARRHARPRVRDVGQPRALAREPDVAEELPQGHHRRRLQRGRSEGPLLQALPLLGLGVPGAAGARRGARAGSRSRRSSSSSRAGSATRRSPSRPRLDMPRRAPSRSRPCCGPCDGAGRRARSGARAAARRRASPSREASASATATGGCSRCTAR